jgi:hypothetical protein
VVGRRLSLPYDEFLEKVVTLASASYYGFTAEILKNVEGLKAFFGFETPDSMIP